MSVDPGVLDANVLAYAVDAAPATPPITINVPSDILFEVYSLIITTRDG
jgi:hypothetical protein